MRKEHALPGVSVSLHLVFYGNPGTGKTSVARLIAEAYRALGVLSKGHLVETDRSGLVAGYLGQTALKVQQVAAEAMGGVLFIDEAYALAPPDHEDPYGAEAIATLLKLMEDHRGELVVIAAGYPGEMKRLLDSNPGLRSRFGKYFNFADYNPDELRAIFEIFCNKGGYQLSTAAWEKLSAEFRSAYEQRDRTFGNARFARNVFERALERQAARIVSEVTVTAEALSRIEPDDIETGVGTGL
jgi:SpoVK/Ycf46/Vps4 family AAA+-type ATPase